MIIMNGNPTLIKKIPSINLKRKVILKAVVTDELKEMHLEAQKTNIENMKKQLEQVQKQIIEGNASPEVLKARQQLNQTIQFAPKQEKDIKNLKNGDIINQAELESFFSAKEGDNLYDLMSDIEVLVKDGIIQKIGNKKDLVQ